MLLVPVLLVVLLLLVGADSAGAGGSVGRVNFGTSFAYLVSTET